MNRKRTIEVPRVTGLRTEKAAYDESHVCDDVGKADVVPVGRRLFSFLNQDFATLKALRLSGDSYANCDTNAVTKPLFEPHADSAQKIYDK